MPDCTSTSSLDPTTAPPFVVYGLCRSRTFWLSRFLTYGGWSCEHDAARHVRGLDDVKAALTTPMTGYVETSASPFWRLVQEMRPDVRTVVVRRPVEAVIQSLAAAGMCFDEANMRSHLVRMDAKLDQIERRVPGAMSVTFDALDDEATCARVFEFCLPFRHDQLWYRANAPLVLTSHLSASIRYFFANQPALLRTARMVGQHMRARMVSRPVSMGGFTFQQERLDTFLHDATALFAEHLAEVGELPDAVVDGNLPLLRRLDEIGMLHITTARSNGRMFGYLVSIISPSFESEKLQEGTCTAFYSSPCASGLGMKLQRAALESLRAIGVGVVTLRAGTRGVGPRMGSLYRRLGAEESGQLFKIDFRKAS